MRWCYCWVGAVWHQWRVILPICVQYSTCVDNRRAVMKPILCAFRQQFLILSNVIMNSVEANFSWGLEILTITQSVSSKWPPGLAFDSRKVNIGIWKMNSKMIYPLTTTRFSHNFVSLVQVQVKTYCISAHHAYMQYRPPVKVFLME
jgi:hypothetical protein